MWIVISFYRAARTSS